MVAFGTVLLVMLFIFLTFNDVKRLFGGSERAARERRAATRSVARPRGALRVRGW